MGAYSEAAEFYDLLYGWKDYTAEAESIRAIMLAACPTAKSVLDVACGTGNHARALTDVGFRVDGIDLEPTFVEAARSKCPEGSFRVADMTDFHLPERYDGITCLFSGIGYVRTEGALRSTIRRMVAHLNADGIVMIEPWFEPGQLTNGRITTLVGEKDDLKVCRMSRTVVDGAMSRLEFEYLVGTPTGIERRSEVHELRLFTESQMRAAFEDAGLMVERTTGPDKTRGLYVGRAVSRPA